MADIELVIKIPEETVNEIRDNAMFAKEIASSIKWDITGAIVNGTPLEQEPFDIETYCKEHFCVMVDKDVWDKAEKALKQEPKTGHWNCGDDMFEYAICSSCKHETGEAWEYAKRNFKY